MMRRGSAPPGTSEGGRPELSGIGESRGAPLSLTPHARIRAESSRSRSIGTSYRRQNGLIPASVTRLPTAIPRYLTQRVRSRRPRSKTAQLYASRLSRSGFPQSDGDTCPTHPQGLPETVGKVGPTWDQRSELSVHHPSGNFDACNALRAQLDLSRALREEAELRLEGLAT